MPKTLQEYADWLDERDLIWPAPPKPVPVKATPSIQPLPGIRAVTWSIYGTLLRISEGCLLFEHADDWQMQIALSKTVDEFNMWNSMTRTPAAPWQYLREQYQRILDERRMVGTGHKGDFPEIDSAGIWRKLIGRLFQKDYDYDRSFYGNFDELSEMVAYFFHANLQGVEASPQALRTLVMVSRSRVRQGLLADAQSFTIVQLLRALKQQGTLPPWSDLFASGCLALSFLEGVRKPSKSLYGTCVQRFGEIGIAPHEVLHVGTRTQEDLAVAKQAGMRTALYAADKTSLRMDKADIKNPDLKPDRLLTELSQILDVLEIR